jgi:hypothetical protein
VRASRLPLLDRARTSQGRHAESSRTFSARPNYHGFFNRPVCFYSSILLFIIVKDSLRFLLPAPLITVIWGLMISHGETERVDYGHSLQGPSPTRRRLQIDEGFHCPASSMANEVRTLRGYDVLKENQQEASSRVTVLWELEVNNVVFDTVTHVNTVQRKSETQQGSPYFIQLASTMPDERAATRAIICSTYPSLINYAV